MPIDPQRIEAVLDLASLGRPVEHQAKAYGSSPRTLWENLALDAVFKSAWSRARECGYFVVADSVLAIHEEFPDADPNLLRVMSDNRKWWLSKLYPSVFGDKLTIREEHVDLKGALIEARTRVITIQASSQAAPGLDETQAENHASRPTIKHLP